MDTTAAAELGMGVPAGTVDAMGFWDPAGGGDEDAWADEDDEVSPPLKAAPNQAGAGGWAAGRASGHASDHPETAGSGQGWSAHSSHEPSVKRSRFSSANSYGANGATLGFGGQISSAGSLGFAPVSGTNSRASGYDQCNSQPPGISPNQFQGGIGFGGGSSVAQASNGGSGSGYMRGRSSTGSIFFKTKLCARFRAGNCPYNGNCNFAHGMEELRKPPPGWEDLVASQEVGGGGGIPNHTGDAIANQSQVSGSASISEPQKFHRSRLCKKFFADGICPYGERCNFAHEDPVFQQQREMRETAEANITPPSSSGGGGGSTSTSGGPNPRPPNWKTRICNKWETTGHCPFGDKCHFAHGVLELQKYGGGSIDSPLSGATYPEVNEASKAASDVSSPVLFGLEGQNSIAQHYSSNGGHGSHLRPNLSTSVGSKIFKAWKGPTEISTVYGDWIEDEECGHDSSTLNVRLLLQSSPRSNTYSAAKFSQDSQPQPERQERPHGNSAVSKSIHQFKNLRHNSGQNSSQNFSKTETSTHAQVFQRDSGYRGSSGATRNALYNGAEDQIIGI